MLEDRGGCGLFLGLRLLTLFLGQSPVLYHAHDEEPVVVLDYRGVGIEGLDGEPLLVDVPAVLEV